MPQQHWEEQDLDSGAKPSLIQIAGEAPAPPTGQAGTVPT
jgi:hypothetical protein